MHQILCFHFKHEFCAVNKPENNYVIFITKLLCGRLDPENMRKGYLYIFGKPYSNLYILNLCIPFFQFSPFVGCSCPITYESFLITGKLLNSSQWCRKNNQKYLSYLSSISFLFLPIHVPLSFWIFCC